MKIGIPHEILPGENRVAMAPSTIKDLKKLGLEFLVEAGAGNNASFSDQAYKEAGAEITADTELIWKSDMVLKVRPPETSEISKMKEGGCLASLVYPARNKEILNEFASKKLTVLAMDMVPRITRAQKMDVLSSMANIAGYRAVIEAAIEFGGFFTGQITAAGKVPPAKVLIIGAGVAGLAAIGTAKSLGAIVRAFDTRPEVADQVKSMGAEFLQVDFKEDGTGEGGYAKVMSPAFIKAEMELFKKQAQEVDIIITTALVPGAKAPILITKEHVEAMKQGSVVVDLAAEQGGNCELTVPGKVHIHTNGVKIIGYTDLAGRLPTQASKLYGTNMYHLLKEMNIEKGLNIDMNNEIIRGCLVTYQGEITYPPPKPAVTTATSGASNAPALSAEELKRKADDKLKAEREKNEKSMKIKVTIWGTLALAFMIFIGLYAPVSFLPHFIVFVLACFVGWQVVWNVTPALHTPLMSVTNAISGIIVVGAMLQVSSMNPMVKILATFSILIATINVVGGFLVTRRMLKMFKR